MNTVFAQQALTGFAALALTAAGAALPGSEANAAPLIFDCYSRSTSDLLMKSALDLSNDNLACVQAGIAGVVVSPVATQPVVVAPATAPAASAGESFLGSVIGGALGGLIGNIIQGGNVREVHHHDRNSEKQNANANVNANLKAPSVEQLKDGSRESMLQSGLNFAKQQQDQQNNMIKAAKQFNRLQQTQAYVEKKQQSEAKANAADPFRKFRFH
jgi:hypothetical protein